MKFNFKIQQYQTDAVNSVVGVFKGQPYFAPVNYRRDIGKGKAAVAYSQMSFADSMLEQRDTMNASMVSESNRRYCTDQKDCCGYFAGYQFNQVCYVQE